MITLLRLGAREAWRHKLRSLLVLVLILVPVAASSAALILVPLFTNEPDRIATQQMGAAQVYLTSGAAEPVWLSDPVWVKGGQPRDLVSVEGSAFTAWLPAGTVGDPTLVTPLDVAQIDSNDPLVSSKYPVSQGRRPSLPGEVALAPATMKRLGLGLGDSVQFAMPDVSAVVVGELDRGVDCPECDGALIGSGTVDRPTAPTEGDPFPAQWTSMSWTEELYVGGLDPQMIDQQGPGIIDRWSATGDPQLMFMTRASWSRPDSNPNIARTWIVAGASFLLLWTGLVAATGLAVGARRRKRDLGLLAANGADPAALRLAVVSEGLVLGAIGSAVGVVVGIIAARLGGPPLAEATSLVTGMSWPTPYAWLVVAWLVGVAAAVAAAWSASVGVTSLTPSQLLRGVRPTPRPAPAWFAVGAVLFIGGCIGLRAGRSMNRFESGGGVQLSWIVIAGSVLALTLGLIAVVVGGTRIAGRLTRSGPTSVRLAGRDLSRQGIRVAAAAAAVAMTLGGAVAAATWDLANRPSEYELQNRSGFVQGLPSSMYDGGASSVGVMQPEFSQLVDGRVLPLTATASTADAMASTGATVGMLSMYDAPAGSLERCVPVWDDATQSEVTQCKPATVAVADEQMLSLQPAEVADALRAGAMVSPAHWERYQTADGALVDVQQFPMEVWVEDYGTVDGGAYDAVTMSAATAASYGVDLAAPPKSATVYLGLDGLSAAQRSSAAAEAASLGFELRVGSWTPTYSSSEVAPWVYVALAAAVGLIALLIVMIALTLVRVESRADDEVLLIAGASPGTSRRVSAARAGLIVVGAAIPATFAGWFTARILINGPAPTPWSAILAALVLLPLIAAVLAGLFHRPARRLTLG